MSFVKRHQCRRPDGGLPARAPLRHRLVRPAKESAHKVTRPNQRVGS